MGIKEIFLMKLVERESLVFFQHIPKTAGTSLTKILREAYQTEVVQYLGCFANYLEDRLCSKEEIVSLIKKGLQAKVITAHAVVNQSLGIFEFKKVQDRLPTREHQINSSFFQLLFHMHDVKAITMLREPIQRIISTFFYCHYKTSKGELFKKILEQQGWNGGNIKCFLNSSLGKSYANLQVKCLANGTEDLELAKKILEHHFDVFGITERFYESLLLMKKVLGWELNIAEYKDFEKNVNPNRPLLKEVPQATIDQIKEYNQLDIELYDFALKLFEKRIANADLTKLENKETLHLQHAVERLAKSEPSSKVEQGSLFVMQGMQETEESIAVNEPSLKVEQGSFVGMPDVQETLKKKKARFSSRTRSVSATNTRRKSTRKSLASSISSSKKGTKRTAYRPTENSIKSQQEHYHFTNSRKTRTTSRRARPSR
ncbi:MAG: hypothetical protein RLZ12_175 [Bacillota bacterium]|jgi:hypothetical protein